MPAPACQRIAPRQQEKSRESETVNATITKLGTPAACGDADPMPEPGALSRLTAACIRDGGIPVTEDDESLIILDPEPRPGPKEKPSPARAPRAGEWEITVDDHAQVTLCFYPRPGKASDPLWIADIATALLTGTPPGEHRSGPIPSRAMGLKAAAGLDLRARGFLVQLNTYPDEEELQLASDVSAHAGDESGNARLVYIADNGNVTFERWSWQDHVATGRRPRSPSRLSDPSATARTIANTIIAAVRTAHHAAA